MKAYKGFNKDMTCRGFQYEIGKEYEEEKAEVCKCGFHACEYPLDCFSYYAPADSKFCEVEQSGDISKDGDDSKVASSIIKIGAEISINSLIKAAYEYIKERCTSHEIGADRSALTGGDSSALTGGEWSVVYGGENSKVRGGLHSVLVLQYWANFEFKGIKYKVVDGSKIKENTYYRLDDKGNFVEVTDEE